MCVCVCLFRVECYKFCQYGIYMFRFSEKGKCFIVTVFCFVCFAQISHTHLPLNFTTVLCPLIIFYISHVMFLFSFFLLLVLQSNAPHILCSSSNYNNCKNCNNIFYEYTFQIHRILWIFRQVQKIWIDFRPKFYSLSLSLFSLFVYGGKMIAVLCCGKNISFHDNHNEMGDFWNSKHIRINASFRWNHGFRLAIFLLKLSNRAIINILPFIKMYLLFIHIFDFQYGRSLSLFPMLPLFPETYICTFIVIFFYYLFSCIFILLIFICFLI